MPMLNKILISLKRNADKSLLFLIMSSILGSVVFGAMIVSQAVINTEMSLRRNLPPIVTVDVVFPSDMSWEVIAGLELEGVTLDLIREIGQLPYVSEMDYSFHMFGWEVPKNYELQLVEREGFEANISTLTTQHLRRRDFIDLNQGLIRIVDGRNFTEEEMLTLTDVFPVLISDKLASLNGLTVGSNFQLDSVTRGEFSPDGGVWGFEETARLHFEFQVIGIFEIASEIIVFHECSETCEEYWENNLSTITLLNRLYTPDWVSTVRNQAVELALSEIYDWWIIEDSSYVARWTQLAFVLNDPLDLPTFETTVNAMLPEFWEVVTLSDTFAPMTGAMQSINWMAEQLVYFVIIVAIVVLTLIIVLMLHGRRHEVGIYLALGEKRWKIIVQMMLEVVINASLGGIVAILLGNVLARTFSEQLLMNELAHQLESRLEREVSFSPVWDSLHWFSPGVISLEEAAELHEITIDAESMIIFIGASLLVVMASSIVPIVYLTKISLKKVLL